MAVEHPEAACDALGPVEPTLFFSANGDDKVDKDGVLDIIRRHSDWHQLMCSLVPKHKIKVNCAVSKDGGKVAAHFTLHNDPVLIKLGRNHAFPRGFCLVVSPVEGRLVGQGTFYPKFANDDRNAEFSAKDFGDVDTISCFLKYSGSAGIITVLRDPGGAAVGWTGSSKNSCNHGAPDKGSTSYPSEVVSVFRERATEQFLAWCDQWRVSSLGLEVFIASDQSHGYGYAASGCIVTAVCVEGGEDGRPIYLPPLRMYAACCEIGLPTDRPILIEGAENIQGFIGELSGVRDMLTLAGLRRVLSERCGVELDTMHDRLIDSHIVEGFVIRRWRGSAEVDSIKFKIWLYQMVTQVLRPSFTQKDSLDFRQPLQSLKAPTGEVRAAFLDLVNKQVGRWCVASDEETLRWCRWVVSVAAEACLPDGHPQLEWSADLGAEAFPAEAPVPEGCVPRSPDRAYWITLGDHAVGRLIAAGGAGSHAAPAPCVK